MRDDSVSRPQHRLVTAKSTNLELTISDENSDLSCRFASLSPDFAGTYGHGAARWVNVLKFQTLWDK